MRKIKFIAIMLLPNLALAATEVAKDPAAIRTAAEAAFEGLDYGKASKLYHELLAVDPEACTAYVKLGLIAENGGDHAQAGAMLDKEPKGCPATADSKRLRKMIEAGKLTARE